MENPQQGMAFPFYPIKTSSDHCSHQALLSVFKGRIIDPTGERETAVERCDVSVEDGEGTAKSRFIIKIVCRHGVLKTYKLHFEEVKPVHALFVKESAHNHWAISSKTLREFVEHFGPGTEQLDIYSEDGRVSFTSYTEKIMSGSGKVETSGICYGLLMCV